MNRKKLIIFICISLIIIGSLAVAVINMDEITFFIHLQKEDIGEYENQVLKSCRSGAPQEFSVSKDGVTYTVPLPNGATEFSNGSYPVAYGEKQFLAINYEIWDNYNDKNILQTVPGFVVDQMAGNYSLESIDGKVEISVSVINFARRYERIVISYRWL